MSTSALGVLAVYLLGLGLAIFSQPIYALFSYMWIFYNDPQTSWWGRDLPDLRYSLFAAVVALAMSVRVKRDGDPKGLNTGTKLLLAYIAWTWIQTAWAVKVPVHIEGAILFTKYGVLAFVIYKLTPDEKSLGLLLWAHIAGCFIFGWKAFGTDVSGRLESIGGPGVDDANLLAAHLITGLVIAGFMVIGFKDFRRWLALLALPFILNAIILTQSRGGFLTLIAAGGAAWYLAPPGYRRWVSMGMIAAALGLLALANEDFWNRISTIFEQNVETTEETRVHLIGPQLQMFEDYPLGAGHRGNEMLSRRYMPPELLSNSGTRSAHNTFMATLVDQGFPGAIMLLGMYLWIIVSLIKLKRLDRQGLPPVLGLYRAGIGAALVSCIVSGLFLNLLKFEAEIWLGAALASLTVLAQKTVAEQREARRAGAAAPSGIAGGEPVAAPAVSVDDGSRSAGRIRRRPIRS